MGAGKSTVGKKLAKRLEMQFYDSDGVVEQKTGVDIATVFEYEGESGFRAREEKVICELCRLENIILATGGGAILSKNTRDLLSEKGTVFYLHASVDTLLERTACGSKRPLLQTPDQRQTTIELLRQREPIYQKIADHVITTDHHTIAWAVDRILQLIPARENEAHLN